uniref:Major sperm protein n=1 Tax=Panagrellus redivivus TaxID=6233 RepID=A0A7E4UQW5_PANRE
MPIAVNTIVVEWPFNFDIPYQQSELARNTETQRFLINEEIDGVNANVKERIGGGWRMKNYEREASKHSRNANSKPLPDAKVNTPPEAPDVKTYTFETCLGNTRSNTKYKPNGAIRMVKECQQVQVSKKRNGNKRGRGFREIKRGFSPFATAKIG